MAHAAQDPGAFLQTILNAVLFESCHGFIATGRLVADIFQHPAEFAIAAVRGCYRFALRHILAKLRRIRYALHCLAQIRQLFEALLAVIPFPFFFDGGFNRFQTVCKVRIVRILLPRSDQALPRAIQVGRLGHGGFFQHVGNRLLAFRGAHGFPALFRNHQFLVEAPRLFEQIARNPPVSFP